MPTYRVVVIGVQQGTDVEVALRGLASLFKKDAQVLRPVLSSGYFVVKRAQDEKTAAQYQAALEKVGCACVIEAELPSSADNLASQRGQLNSQRQDASAIRPSVSQVYCKQCGAPVVSESKFCGACGSQVVSSAATPRLTGITPAPAQASPPQQTAGYEAAEKPYYVERFAAFDANGGAFKATWNWAAFLFGVFWYFYKGLWAKGALMVAIIVLMAGMPALFFWLYAAIAGNFDYYLLRRRGTQLWSTSGTVAPAVATTQSAPQGVPPPKHEDVVTPTPSSSSELFLGLKLHYVIILGGFVSLLFYGYITTVAPSKNSDIDESALLDRIWKASISKEGASTKFLEVKGKLIKKGTVPPSAVNSSADGRLPAYLACYDFVLVMVELGDTKAGHCVYYIANPTRNTNTYVVNASDRLEQEMDRDGFLAD